MAQAKAGLPESQHALGVMFYHGDNGLAQNYVMAAKWFREPLFKDSPTLNSHLSVSTPEVTE